MNRPLCPCPFSGHSVCNAPGGRSLFVKIRAAELVQEGFGIEPSEIVAIAADYRALHAEPTRRDLVWRYGIASEIMDPVRRTTEIGNWLLTVVERRGFVA